MGSGIRQDEEDTRRIPGSVLNCAGQRVLTRKFRKRFEDDPKNIKESFSVDAKSRQVPYAISRVCSPPGAWWGQRNP